MKKLLVVLFMAFSLAVPCLAWGGVESSGVNISLHGHIDYVYRYSEPDDHINDDGLAQVWSGYETHNLELAMLGMSGQAGDNVSWTISYAFAFAGPRGATDSETASEQGNNAVAGTLLDARINLEMAEGVTLSFGRFIPETSMTWCPHKMSVLHTVNYPLVHGSGVASSEYEFSMFPLPMYQTGMMVTAGIGPVRLIAGAFNGNQVMGGDDLGNELVMLGNDNTMDMDRNKGLLVKAAYDGEGFHLGGWYYAEDASVSGSQITATTAYAPGADAVVDARSARWGIEGSYSAHNLVVAAEYIQSTYDAEDDASAWDDNLVQTGYYLLLGYNMERFEVVARYDYVNYDGEESALAPAAVDPADYNEEAAVTAGVNYFLNEQTTVGFDYTWRSLESYESKADELALIIELDLF